MVKNCHRDNGTVRGRRFMVFGRSKPTSNNEEPELTVIRVFAKNQAFARSKFWKIMRVQNKIKKSKGEIIKVQEMFDQGKVQAKNIGIYLKYRSNVGVQNQYKEFRAVSVADALDQLYNEMGGNYKCSRDRVEIIRHVELEEDQMKIRNPRCLQWVKQEQIAYPLWKKTARHTDSKYNSVFQSSRPSTYKTGISVNN